MLYFYFVYVNGAGSVKGEGSYFSKVKSYE